MYILLPFYICNFDRYTIVALIYYFTLSEMIELVRIRNDVEDITEGLFLTLTYVSLCLKCFNILVRQYELRSLLDCFRTKLCQPKDSAEESILRRYDLKGTFIISKKNIKKLRNIREFHS